jgi:hypothetical protein
MVDIIILNIKTIIMKKFIALYYNTSGAHQAAPELSPEQQAEMMAPWGVWQEKYGERIVELGAPCMPAFASENGRDWSASKNFVTGYSIVAANNLEEAKSMFEKHPIYHYPAHAIEISECAEM